MSTETEIRPARRPRLRRRLLLPAALIAFVLLAFLFAKLIHRDTQPVITADLVSQRLAAVQELATVEYYYTNVGHFENQLDFYGWSIPFTRKGFIVSYDGVIRAGVDLSQMTVRIDGDVITVKLPPAVVLSHEIPEDSIVVFDETHNIFNPIEISDYTGFTRDQKSEIEARAAENGLLTQASERARSTVKQLLSLMPEAGHYTLKIE